MAIFLSPLFLFSQETTQSLNSNWQFSESGKNEWLPAIVPGTIHTDLLANKKIPDPYLSTNESKVQWVETKTWEYKSTFNASDELWKCKHKELIFEGLDTYADVYLNEKLILTSTDMFLPATIDVTTLLKKENNALRIVFHPASELIAKNKAKSSVKNIPGGDRAFIRKAQYQFGWDWGPRLVTCGIWKKVRLKGFDEMDIQNIYLQTLSIKNDTAFLNLMTSFDNYSKAAKKYKIEVTDGSHSYLKSEFNCQQGMVGIGFSVIIPHPKLWWSNNNGKPYLYDFDCKITCEKFIHEEKIKYGIRTIELKQDSDASGTSFSFYLNGQPVFIKGANWIPCDNFIPRITSGKYYSLIKSAQQSNMNMLRVWGGGIYENEQFYNDCDSLGILVWQDFMFAGEMIPSDSAFLKQIWNECSFQYEHIRGHSCVAVWCGNNEINEGWKNWGWQKEYKINKKDSAELYTHYKDLFSSFLSTAIVSTKIDNYISSSPSTGWGHPEAYKSGDVHYWGVWWGNEPFSSYDNHVGRFMSEYGMQSLPDLTTIRKFDSGPDISLTDSTMIAHQKSENGFSKINSY
ncbi:MAG TPA: glycoside hydrolase family 2 protein, partial [Bacteroidia bacterium]|nr:glycoside hydrolase family 2 protein [Bacteroidia bacterium]